MFGLTAKCWRGLLLLLALTWAQPTQAQTLSVAAGASLREVLQAIVTDYQQSTGVTVTFNFGGSGVLLSQIKQGAPIDVYIAAAQSPVDQARELGLLRDDEVRIIARNQLVLIVPRGANIAKSGFMDLSQKRIKHLAIGQPKTVPAGVYAMQVLDHLQLTGAVKDRLVYGGSVRQVLDYVIRGEVDAGVVYRSDVYAAGGKVMVAQTAGDDWHEPVVYPAAILQRCPHPQTACEFIAHLLSPAAQQVFEAHGFIPVSPLGPQTPTLAAGSPANVAPTVRHELTNDLVRDATSTPAGMRVNVP